MHYLAFCGLCIKVHVLPNGKPSKGFSRPTDPQKGQPTMDIDATGVMAASEAKQPGAEEERHPFLVALGERVRTLRSRRGMTRKAVAIAADVSERHLANLEYGTGNASILVLLQVAQALQCSLAELLGDVSTSSPEWLLIRELLENATKPTCAGLASPSAACWAAARPVAATPGARRASPSSACAGRASPPWASGWPTTWVLPSSSSAAKSRNSPAAASTRSTPSTARRPTAATSAARWKRRSRSTPRW